MKPWRVAGSVMLIGIALVSIGSATAWLSDSGRQTFSVSAAQDFEPHQGKVWVCRVVGPPDDRRVAPGKNPISVSIESTIAQEGLSDTHPSYIVEDEDSICQVRHDEDMAGRQGAVAPETSTTIAVTPETTMEEMTTTTTLPAATTTTATYEDATGSSTTTTTLVGTSTTQDG